MFGVLTYSGSHSHYDQHHAFEIFFHQVSSLKDEGEYLFQEYDISGNKYNNSDKVFTGKQLKNRSILLRLTSHFTHRYSIAPVGESAASSIYFSHIGIPQKVDKILH